MNHLIFRSILLFIGILFFSKITIGAENLGISTMPAFPSGNISSINLTSTSPKTGTIDMGYCSQFKGEEYDGNCKALFETAQVINVHYEPKSFPGCRIEFFPTKAVMMNTGAAIGIFTGKSQDSWFCNMMSQAMLFKKQVRVEIRFDGGTEPSNWEGDILSVKIPLN